MSREMRLEKALSEIEGLFTVNGTRITWSHVPPNPRFFPPKAGGLRMTFSFAVTVVIATMSHFLSEAKRL